MVFKSYGIRLYDRTRDNYLVIQRKHTAYMVLIMRGIFETRDLARMLEAITEQEAAYLIKVFEGGELAYIEASKEFDSPNYQRQSIFRWPHLRDHEDLIRRVLATADLSRNFLTWNWPKGRLEANESTLECAIRELHEETGIDLNLLDAEIGLMTCMKSITIQGRELYDNIYQVSVDYVDQDIVIQTHEAADVRWVSAQTVNLIHEHYTDDWHEVEVRDRSRRWTPSPEPST